jgi:hypothetical protein
MDWARKTQLRKKHFLDFYLRSCLIGNFKVTQDNFNLLRVNNSVLVIQKKILKLQVLTSSKALFHSTQSTKTPKKKTS